MSPSKVVTHRFSQSWVLFCVSNQSFNNINFFLYFRVHSILMSNFVLRRFSRLVDASFADVLIAHFATLQEKLVIPGRYPSFAHITILSLDDLREFAHLVAMTCLGLGPYTIAYKMSLTGWTCAPLFIRIKATRRNKQASNEPP